MNNILKMTQYPLRAVSLLLALGLSACSQSYVVLLSEEDGSLGKVQLTTQQGVTLLETDRAGVIMDGQAGQTFTVSEIQIQEDFGTALSASPQKPQIFFLYFEGGGATLTAESMETIPNIINEIKGRPAVDISIIGHTDSVGDDEDNVRLSLERAKSIKSIFTEVMPDPSKITVDSHGEKNLLVKTPDDTDEPKNRRVEITVR